jgi:sugar lactone lactonase YvrE
VRVSTFDGSHDETLVNQLPHPSALTVDDPNGLVYWTDVETMEILRSPLGNSSAETVLPARIDVSDLGGLAIDSDRDLLYFSYVNPLIDGLYPGSIGRLDLTTKTVETVVNGLSRPRGVALADGHLFWADDLLGTGGVIGRSDLATGEKTLIVKELQSPEGLAIDLTSQQLYWTDTAAGAIERANFDGSDPRQILIGLDRPSALAIAVVPEPSSALLLAVGWLTCMVALCRPSRRG